jgi:dCTP deaminase
MRFLNDESLVKLITGVDPIIRDVPQPPGGNWYGPDSAVQPLSVDLHIGEIHVPPKEPESTQRPQEPRSEYILRAGYTAIIKTGETLVIPSDMAGFGFPPADVSIKGLLMTNPGHVDPGYVGAMHFTVINMAREDYTLRRGDRIFTLLLVDLEEEVHSDYLKRRKGQVKQVSLKPALDRLCLDFANVESRAARIVDDAVSKAELSVKNLGHKVAIWVVVLGGFFTLLTAGFQYFKPGWTDLDRRITKIEAVQEAKNEADKRVDELSRRLDEFEKTQRITTTEKINP